MRQVTLANLYNNIKASEVRAASGASGEGAAAKMAEWKAGFIEDADILHLAAKPMIASIIKAWSSEEGVQHAFANYTIGNKNRFDLVRAKAEAACERESKKW